MLVSINLDVSDLEAEQKPEQDLAGAFRITSASNVVLCSCHSTVTVLHICGATYQSKPPAG